MKKTVFLVISLVFLASCAGPNPSANVAGSAGNIAGFWAGLVHGVVAPFSFLVSLFDPSVHFYEVHNNGNMYNLGFAIGVGMLDRGRDKIRSKK